MPGAAGAPAGAGVVRPPPAPMERAADKSKVGALASCGRGTHPCSPFLSVDILRYIDQQWSFMSSDNCVPVKVALQLMDQSSLGLANQHVQFKDTHQQLQDALKSIVNEHHQGFNSSIGTFHQIQASIHASQTRVRTLKQSLVNAKGSLRTTRPELKAFATSSQSYDQMLQALGYIEQLQSMPEKLEAEISEKRFLAAVETLQDALKLMRKPEMEDIAALADLRLYFNNQEHVSSAAAFALSLPFFNLSH